MSESRGRHLRQREDEEQRATNLELFFDLVFVFAVTQLSHTLLSHLTLTGAGRTLFMLLVVWWGWTYTTWMTNWFDPDAIAVRLVLIGCMLASLMMAIAIPEAFGDRALLFAGGYTALQVVRNLFVVWATEDSWPQHVTFVGITWWSFATAILWIAGAFASFDARIVIWALALAIDYAGPYAGYWLPGRGGVTADDWQIEGSHFAERFQLFIIIALGESIVVTGATASSLQIDLARGAAISVAFIGSAALWWLYFSYVASVSQRRLGSAEERGELARDAYTYLHAVMVAGIIVSAVGDELSIAHPGSELQLSGVLTIAGGPALYLLGHVLFRLRMAGSLSRKRLAGSGAVALAGLAGLWIPALACAALVAAALVGVVVAEIVSARRRWPEGPPEVEEVEKAMTEETTV
jgi:low temperature requirement protein LtrA